MHTSQVFRLLAFALSSSQVLALPTGRLNNLEIRSSGIRAGSSGARTVAEVYNWSDSEDEEPKATSASKEVKGFKRK